MDNNIPVLNIASIYIEKTFVGQKCFIKQIAVVFMKNNKFKYICKYIKNDCKESYYAVELSNALTQIYEIIKGKELFLFNVDGEDYTILKTQLEALGLKFDNIIYDVSLAARKLQIKKINLKNLAHIFKCYTMNRTGLPSSVNMAQNLYLVGINIFFKTV